MGVTPFVDRRYYVDATFGVDDPTLALVIQTVEGELLNEEERTHLSRAVDCMVPGRVEKVCDNPELPLKFLAHGVNNAAEARLLVRKIVHDADGRFTGADISLGYDARESALTEPDREQ